MTRGANAAQVPGPSTFGMIECEQPLVGSRMNELPGEKWIARSLLMQKLYQRGATFRPAVQGIREQPCQILKGQRRKDDLLHGRGFANRVDRAHERMESVDFVVSV